MGNNRKRLENIWKDMKTYEQMENWSRVNTYAKHVKKLEIPGKRWKTYEHIVKHRNP